MVKLKKRLSQQDFVGGLFHAFMVCYDETLKTHGEEHADEWLILHDVILSLTFLVSGLEAGEPDAKLRDILDEFHGKVAVGMVQAGVPRGIVPPSKQRKRVSTESLRVIPAPRTRFADSSGEWSAGSGVDEAWAPRAVPSRLSVSPLSMNYRVSRLACWR